MSSAAYYESDRGARPPAPTPLRRPLNTGQESCSTADLLDRRRRYLDPALRRLLGPAYVAAVIREIEAALAARARGGAA